MKFLSLIYVFLISLMSIAQSSVNAGGSRNNINGLKFTYTLGQPFGAKVFVGEKKISEGVQQPIELIRIVSGLLDLSIMKFDISPNPTDDLLNVKLIHPEIKNLVIRMIDFNGKELINQAITQEEFVLDIKNYPSATYFLGLFKSEILIGSYKIIKN